MEKIIILELKDDEVAYIKASSVEAIWINKVEMNELRYVICIRTNSGKEFNSKVYEGCINVQEKFDEVNKFIFDGHIKDENVHVLD